MQKTDELKKSAETDQTKFNFSVWFQFGSVLVLDIFYLETDQTDRFIYIYIFMKL